MDRRRWFYFGFAMIFLAAGLFIFGNGIRAVDTVGLLASGVVGGVMVMRGVMTRNQ